MRECVPQVKVEATETIPRPLVSFLKEVCRLIEKGDPLATTPSDDLLQRKRMYGGLNDEASGLYSFTYFPGDGNKVKWEFDLTVSQISEIAAGSTAELGLWQCPVETCKNRFGNNDDLCFYCDYRDDEPGPVMPDEVEVARCKNRKDWALCFLQKNPGIHWSRILSAYNGADGLGDKFGWFTTDELQIITGDKKKPWWEIW